MTLNSCSNNFLKIKSLDLVHIVILGKESDKIDAFFSGNYCTIILVYFLNLYYGFS